MKNLEVSLYPCATGLYLSSPFPAYDATRNIFATSEGSGPMRLHFPPRSLMPLLHAYPFVYLLRLLITLLAGPGLGTSVSSRPLVVFSLLVLLSVVCPRRDWLYSCASQLAAPSATLCEPDNTLALPSTLFVAILVEQCAVDSKTNWSVECYRASPSFSRAI
ncbi:hypothetical protein C8R47DRAFT_531199 [Mycena vitilis]|nr:hypothetical protein C8R47DRAFT_531199 [Mycena vitilis]